MRQMVESFYIRRKFDDFLVRWKSSNCRLPLIVKGARQVGKTESIRNFARRHYENIVEINFALEPEYRHIVDDEAQAGLRANSNLGVYKGGIYENIVADALVRQWYELSYYKREDSMLEEDFFVRDKQQRKVDFLIATDDEPIRRSVGDGGRRRQDQSAGVRGSPRESV